MLYLLAPVELYIVFQRPRQTLVVNSLRVGPGTCSPGRFWLDFWPGLFWPEHTMYISENVGLFAISSLSGRASGRLSEGFLSMFFGQFSVNWSDLRMSELNFQSSQLGAGSCKDAPVGWEVSVAMASAMEVVLSEPKPQNLTNSTRAFARCTSGMRSRLRQWRA